MANDQISVLLQFLTDTGPLLEAQQQLNTFIKTMQAGFSLDIGGGVASFLTALPGKFVAAINAATAYGESIANMADQSRLTASSFQVLSLMATQSGMEVSKMTTAVQQLSIHTEEAVNGNEAMAGAFERLGINAQQFSGLAVPIQLEALAKAGAAAGWSTQALDDIFKLLGTRSGPQMIGVLKQLAGPEGFAGAAKAASDLGAVVDDKAVAALARLAGQQKETAQVWKAKWAEMAADTVPIQTAVSKISEFIGSRLPEILKGFAVGGGAGAGIAAGISGPQGAAGVNTGQGSGLTPQPAKGELATGDGTVNAKDDNGAGQKQSDEMLKQIQLGEKEAEQTQIELDQADVKMALMDEEADKENAKLTLKEREEAIDVRQIATQEQLKENERQRAAIEKDKDVSNKTADLLANTAQYKALLEQIIKDEQARLLLVTDPKELAMINAKIAELQAEEKAGPKKGEKKGDEHFTSVAAAGKSALASFANQAGTVADSVNRGFTTILEGLSGGISKALDGLINRTMTWHQALMSVGNAVLSSVVSAFTKMVAQYMVSRLAMVAINLMGGATEKAAQSAQAATAAASWAPAATLASIASYGTADAVGLAAMAGSLASGSALGAAAGAIGSAAQGGHMGSGQMMLVGEHGPELVVPSEASVVMNHKQTGAIIENLVALSSLSGATNGSLSANNRGRFGTFGPGQTGGSPATGGKTSITLVDDRQSALTALRRSAGQAKVVQIMRNSRAEFYA